MEGVGQKNQEIRWQVSKFRLIMTRGPRLSVTQQSLQPHTMGMLWCTIYNIWWAYPQKGERMLRVTRNSPLLMHLWQRFKHEGDNLPSQPTLHQEEQWLTSFGVLAVACSKMWFHGRRLFIFSQESQPVTIQRINCSLCYKNMIPTSKLTESN